jgi:asparagine synthase (glutamine-hydrolysing)
MRELARRMAKTVQHRGPDDAGTWADAEVGVALGHRRLSILDLSPLGHQPMVSACSRYVVVYNGEIYNFRELRADLEGRGHSFASESDTEVMLAAFSQWGVVDSISRMNGMFAIAVWDRQEHVLTLLRDRLGQKPLYYGRVGRALVFGSELKPFHVFPGFGADIDRNALTLLLRRGCIAAPFSIFKGVNKLLPGHYVTIRADDRHEEVVQAPYWSLSTVLESARTDPFTGTEAEAVDALDELLRDATRLCLVSDVPLGAFLSGGIDSSTIAAMMQATNTGNTRTFSIGFTDASHDEAPHAARVAAHLGTDHTEMYVTERDALDVIPQLPNIYDEPFADASQIPTFLLSRLTRQHVTVALSGDGGDELFGGYGKYRYFDRARHLARLPRPLRAAVAASLRATGRRQLGRIAAVIEDAGSPDEIYIRLASIWKRPDEVVVGATEPEALLSSPQNWPALDEPVRSAMAVDTLTYLPDDILVKVDRAAMAVSLETRIPLLDRRVVEFAARLPLRMNYDGRQGKLLLRQVLSRYVPQELVERSKMGFDVPLASWLRGDLRDWADGLLDEARLREEGYFQPAPIRDRWQQHLAEENDWSGYLWPVLMFHAWLVRHS